MHELSTFEKQRVMTRSYCLTLADGCLLVVVADRCRREGACILFETRDPAAREGWAVKRLIYRGRLHGTDVTSGSQLPEGGTCPAEQSSAAGPGRLPARERVPVTPHPNQREIDELYAGLHLLTDVEVYRLSDTWTGGPARRRARWRALHPDTPAVTDCLRILLGLPVLVPTRVPEPIRDRAVNALSDAFVAAYGRPRLTPALYQILMRAYWHAVAFTAGAGEGYDRSGG